MKNLYTKTQRRNTFYESGLNAPLHFMYIDIQRQNKRRANWFRNRLVSHGLIYFADFINMDLELFKKIFKDKKTRKYIIEAIHRLYERGYTFRKLKLKRASNQLKFINRKIYILDSKNNIINFKGEVNEKMVTSDLPRTYWRISKSKRYS